MNKQEVRSLVLKVVNHEEGISYSEFEALYMGAFQNGQFPDVLLLSFLGYLQARIRDDPDTQDALGLVKTTIDLVLSKDKHVFDPKPTDEQRNTQ